MRHHASARAQGQKVKRHKRLFKKQEAAVAPVGRDGMAREFGGANEYEDLEGAPCTAHTRALRTPCMLRGQQRRCHICLTSPAALSSEHERSRCSRTRANRQMNIACRP